MALQQGSTPPKVNPSTVEKAISSLLNWRKSKIDSKNPQLLEQDDFVYLILTLKKIPPNSRVNPYRVTLKNPLHTSDSELCLIVDDRPKSGLNVSEAKNKIKTEEIPISKVLKLSKLKSNYREFEAKRKLFHSYDVFFADKRIIPLLPRLLGKQFFKKKKIPISINLTHKNWKEQVEKACGSALLYLRSGTCSVVRVAKASMKNDDIVANVVDAIDGVVEFVPKKWDNVRSMHLKFPDSLALPIYQALPDLRLRIEGVKVVGDEKEKVSVGEKDGKLGKKKKVSKKGRIHEVKYMDVDSNVGDDELGSDGDDCGDGIEGGKSENGDVGSGKFGGKKRKNGDLNKGNGEEVSEKVSKKVKKGKKERGMGYVDSGVDEKLGSNGDNGDIEGEKSGNDEVGSGELKSKKRKKGGLKEKKGLKEGNDKEELKKLDVVFSGEEARDDGKKERKNDS